MMSVKTKGRNHSYPFNIQSRAIQVLGGCTDDELHSFSPMCYSHRQRQVTVSINGMLPSRAASLELFLKIITNEVLYFHNQNYKNIVT